MRIVQKILEGKFILVELLDADCLSGEQIMKKLEANRSNLAKMGSPSVFAFQVFIFNSEPDEGKMQLIKQGQMEDVYLKKYLPCISVDLENRKVNKLYDLPIQTEGLENILNLMLGLDVVNADVMNDNDIRINTERLGESEGPPNFLAKVPYVTYCLMIINIAIWLVMNIYARIKNIDVSNLFIPFGAKENFSIMSGEYWRFITPIFLHADLEHLFANSLSLFVFGRIVEGMYGHKKFTFIYLAAGVIGNVASFMFSTYSGVGASGSIFGFFGALLYLWVENPAAFRRYFGNNILIMIVINLAYGFASPGIDNFAHVGGLIGGFLTSGIVKLKGVSNKLLGRSVFIAATIIVVILGLYYGFNNSRNRDYYIERGKYKELVEMADSGKWKEAEKLGEEIINMRPERNDIKLSTLYNIAAAEASQGKYDEALETAESVKKVDAPKGYYLRGLLYLDTKQYELARQELNEAVKLNPEYKEEVDQYLKQIEEELR